MSQQPPGALRTGATPVREPFFKAATAKEDQQSSWNASGLILENNAEQTDEEDLQCYQIRREYTDVSWNDGMDEMLRVKQELVSAWDERGDLPGGLPDPDERRYLEIEKELTGSQITDETQQKILMLKNGSGSADSSMKEFYAAFSLLQGSPSRERIADVIRGIDALGEETDDGLSLLRMAIEEALELQNARNARTDWHYQDKQNRYDRVQRQAQTEFDKAKRRTDRWR
ncbi:MAG: hypothetical protein IJI24_02025 [Lachnospiraceae bacterium]|nr:hypothetical protein [Lachnospiraceae bacterium]